MRKAGQLTAEASTCWSTSCSPGVTTAALDNFAYEFGLRPRRHAGDALLQGLPALDLHLDQPRRLPRHPERRPLREGDIVNIDLTLIVDGWHGNSSRMYAVGRDNRARPSG